MQKRIGDYILIEKIGSGAFGQVYLAKSIEGDQMYAVKVINKDKMTQRIRSYLDREVSILQKLSSPHVVKLHDVKLSVHNYYLIFEYCNGGDLSQFKNKEGGRLSETVVRRIMRQVVDGLSSVYALGGIHRDIKLSNVLLHYPSDTQKNEPIAKICDFGFARLVESEAPLEMSIVGTPINMSPEMLQNLPYTVKSDVWGLGTITYELLCGKDPFKASDKESLKRVVNMGEYRLPKALELSTEAVDFISSCLQYNAGNRLDWRDLSTHPFISTEKKTAFDFITMKKANTVGLEEAKECYMLSSKVKYCFSSVYPSAETKEDEEECKSEEDFGSRDDSSENSKSEAECANVDTWTTQEINKEYIKIDKNGGVEGNLDSEYVII
eukprot:TRINITY_DN4220_c0_g3_i1.p1 TRINITY_DN4220_c0_g3~~TRINITY_DN4220_c0_g3_i1.p1  ORF type:complete len:381 (+),score=99.84 TRINITY_DN4220_c0_g3_i1:153-1295(+)